MKYLILNWQRPFTIEQVEEVLTTLAETRPRGNIVFEIRSEQGHGIQYLIGCEARFIGKVKAAFEAHGEVKFRDLTPQLKLSRSAENAKLLTDGHLLPAGSIVSGNGSYGNSRNGGEITASPDLLRMLKAPTTARLLKVSKNNLSLNTDISVSLLRSALSTMHNLHEQGATAVVQIILGAAYPPRSPAADQPDPNASWLDIVLGNTKKASSDQIKSMKQKVGQYSYEALIRIGASGTYAEGTLNSLTGAFRTMSSAGVRVGSVRIDPMDIVTAKIPWRLPLRLSVAEIAMSMLLPVGDEEYPGVGGIHPLNLDPPSWYYSPDKPWLDRTFALAGGSNLNIADGITAGNATAFDEPRLSISPKDSLEHTVILGPTGAGKSTVMLNLIMADINAGRSVMVIDPKADLVSDILSRIPEHRLKDVVVIDPSDDNAVGWNPLAVCHSNGRNATGSPELIADAILAVFREIFSENWGIRAQDILSAALQTLAGHRDATLMWLPALLTDQRFRDGITKDVKDQVALKPFWDQYDSMKESERRTMIESSLNKVRQIMFRPGLRNILGQAHPKFQLSQLFTERKIVLVPLNKGLIGADSARLLGSLLVGMTWIEVLSRANIPKQKRHIVSMYIDELQDYVSLPNSFADSLAQARGLGLAITVAHQYRAQLDPNLREGIDANCRNKIVFGLSASDASSIAHQAPELAPIDFISLPRYHIYTSFMVNGKGTGWISGVTLPATEALRLPAEAKALSQQKYGRPSKEVEAEIISALYPPQAETSNPAGVAGSTASTDANTASAKAALDPTGNAEAIAELKRSAANNDQAKQTVVGAKQRPQNSPRKGVDDEPES